MSYFTTARCFSTLSHSAPCLGDGWLSVICVFSVQVRGTPTVSLVVYWAIERTALREAGEGGQRGKGGTEDSTAHLNGLRGLREAGFSEIFRR